MDIFIIPIPGKIIFVKRIKVAESADEIENCYAVMAELRPHLGPEEFAAQVERQMKESGYRLVYLEEGDEIKAVAGIRIAEWLAGGRALEIEDLVAKSVERSKGFGGGLFEWIVRYARENNCRQIKLVSHVRRCGAHKFYLNKGMKIEAHYFSLAL
jgi:GNAT superfamily N-acetyltransferase